MPVCNPPIDQHSLLDAVRIDECSFAPDFIYIYIFRIIDGSIMRNNVHSCNEKFRSLDNNNKVIRDNDNYARYRNYKLVSCEIIYIKDIIISRCEIFR